jgi:apolipoprotein N-acyltransferase
MRAKLALAALSGLLTFAAFPGVGVWPLGFVAWVPLLLALEDTSRRRAAVLGLVAGLAATLPGFRFLYPTLRAESGFGPLLCVLLVAAVAAYHALRGLVIGFVSRLMVRDPGPPALLFIAGLALSELAVPSLFPWYFGASVHNVPLLLQTAELGGPIAVSVVLAFSSVAVAETVSALRANRRTRPRVIVTALSVPIAAAFWGSLRISEIDQRARAAPALSVGVVQPNLARGEEIEAVRRHREATAELAAKGAGLVVWAEGAVPWTLPAPYVEDAFALFRLPRVAILAGAIVQGDSAAAGDAGARGSVEGGTRASQGDAIEGAEGPASVRVTNSALLFDAGHFAGRYDKHHLLPFSESLPLAGTFPVLREWSPRSGHFAPGRSFEPLRLHGHGIAAFICYEDLLPEHVRALARGGDVELLVNLTNDSWFLGTDEPRVHLALAKLRAVEQRKYLVRATLTGVSAIVDPVGRVLGTVPQSQEGTLLADVRWMRGTTIYGRVGDLSWWVLIAGSLGFALGRRRAPSTAA